MAIVDRVNRDMQSFSDEYGELLVKELRRQLAVKDKYATGTLADTMYHQVKTVEGKSIVKIYAEPYLRQVDKGRAAGKFPNMTALSKWLDVRLIPQEALFPIGRKIKEKGIKPTPIITPSIKEIEREFLPKYEKQLANMVGVVLENDVFNQTTTKGRIISKKFK